MKILMIGAGGIGSYLLPVMLKSFPDAQVELWDADKLEERNLDRQQFSESFVGQPKALALVDMLPKDMQHRVYSVVSWFTDASVPATESPDVIIACPDNHMARYAAICLAKELFIPAILAGNDYFDSQADLFLPELEGTKFDVLVRHPEIATDKEGSPTTASCTGEAQEATPQLALANQRAAGHVLHLLANLPAFLAAIKKGGGRVTEEMKAFPISISTTRYSVETLHLS